MIFDDELELAIEYRRVLADIDPEHPAGEPLWSGSDPDWDLLRALRRAPQPDILAEVDEPPQQDWTQVAEVAARLLANRSKDLQVAAWLTQALTRSRGLSGMRVGLFVTRQLLERYASAGLHPDEPEDREDILAWLDAELARELRAMGPPNIAPASVQPQVERLGIHLPGELARTLAACKDPTPVTPPEPPAVEVEIPEPLAPALERLLQPVDDAQPAGSDLWLGASTQWYELRRARAGDRGGRLSPGIIPVEKQDWNRVEALATDLLTKVSKDLQVAAWLAEAYTQLRGFDGLRDGLLIVVEIYSRFRDTGLYPQDEYARENLLHWFGSELESWIGTAPLTPAVDGVSYSLQECYAIERAHPDSGDPADAMERHLLAGQIRRSLEGPEARQACDRILRSLNRTRLQLERFASETQFASARASATLAACIRLVEQWKSADPAGLAGLASDESASPESLADPWERALAWVRLHQLDLASPLIEQTLTAQPSERYRFYCKLQLADALAEVGRSDLAAGILAALSEQIAQFQLEQWEGPALVAQVWQRLHQCTQAARHNPHQSSEIEKKLFRLAPWTLLR